MTRRRCCCCISYALTLTDGAATRLKDYWLVDDLDNVTIDSQDVVTVEDDTLRLADSAAADDAVSGAHTSTDTTITTTGSATYEGNRTIKFADHATLYTVVKHVGTTMTITPGLSQNVDDATVIEDQTPLRSLRQNEAYYLKLRFKTSTGVVEIHQGSGPANSLSVDIDSQTIDFNSEPTEDLPYPHDNQWHWMQFYICPTHSMGEASIAFNNGQSGVPTEYQSFPNLSYGATVVDDSAQTADNDFEIEVIGEATISTVTHSSAQVTMLETAPAGYDYYDYYEDEVVIDCGRRDLFPCPWPFMKQMDTGADVSVADWDEPLDDGAPDPPGATVWGDFLIWYPVSGTVYTSPTDQRGFNGCLIFAWRQHVLESPPGTFIISWRGGNVGNSNVGGLYYEAWAEYVRDNPTAAEPYPLPYGRATLRYRDLRPSLDSDCDDEDITVLNLDDAASIADAWTMEATLAGGGDCDDRDSDSTITWDHPA